MKSIRPRLSYANVISTVALFLALGGGAALAATALEPNSVGTVQLKPQAVTAVKIKAGAVVASRISDGAVTSGKVADGSVTTGKIAAGAVTSDRLAGGAVTTDRIADGAVSTGKLANRSVTADKLAAGVVPVSQVVARLRGTASVAFPVAPAVPVPYPLDNPTYTQPAGEDDLWVAGFQATFAAACGGRRSARAELLIDAPGGASEIVGEGVVEDQSAGEATRTGQFAAPLGPHGFTSVAPTASTPHTFSIRLVRGNCTTGAGVRMTGAQIDAIGVR